jgi:hypothetical protein
MAWIVWAENPDKDRREYVRRVGPGFVSWTVHRDDARRWRTRAEARAAIRGTGLTAAYRPRQAADA